MDQNTDKGLEEFLTAPEAEPLDFVDRLTPERAARLFDLLVRRAEITRKRPAEYTVLQRILETANPEEYLETAQPAEERLAVRYARTAAFREESLGLAKQKRPRAAQLAADSREVAKEMAKLGKVEAW